MTDLSAPRPKGKVEVVNFSKRLLSAYRDKVRAGEIKPSSNYILRFSGNPKVHVRVTKDDLTFVTYGWHKILKRVKTQKLGTFTEYENRPNWIEELKAEKSIQELERESACEDLGIDEPSPAIESEAETISSLFEIYFASDKFQQFASRAGIKGQITKHILSRIGERNWDSVKKKELREIRDEVLQDCSNSTANRVFGYFSGGLRWLEANHFDVEDFRFPRLEKLSEADANNRKALPNLQLRALWHASKVITNKRAGAVIRACILTGQRENVIAKLKWSEIVYNKEQGCAWIVPADKGNGVKLKLPVPISLEVLGILREYRDDTDAIFPTKPGKFVELDGHIKTKCEAIMSRYLKKHGKTQEQRTLQAWCFHSVRKNVRNKLGELGIDNYTAEELLSHSTPFVTRVEGHYHTRQRNAEKVDAMRQLNSAMLQILEGDIENALADEIRPDGIPILNVLDDVLQATAI